VKRALVIGASGYIGGALCGALRDAGWSVLATAPGGLRGAAHQLGRMVDAGDITPVVDRGYPLREGAGALRAIDERRVAGKAVLLP